MLFRSSPISRLATHQLAEARINNPARLQMAVRLSNRRASAGQRDQSKGKTCRQRLPLLGPVVEAGLVLASRVLDLEVGFTILRVKDTGLWSPIQPSRGAFAKATAQKKSRW